MRSDTYVDSLRDSWERPFPGLYEDGEDCCDWRRRGMYVLVREAR